MKCPCYSNKNYSTCCRPYHEKKKRPETPESLMRSRYSAYALNLPNYIIETTHKDNPTFEKDLYTWKQSIQIFSTTTIFRGLDILASSQEGPVGFVLFHAHLSSLKGDDLSFKEKSTFVQKKGLWLYRSGDRI